MKEKRGDIFSGIVIGVLAVVYYVYSFQIQQTTSDVLGSRFFPQLAAILLLVLSAILIIQALRKKSDSEEENKNSSQRCYHRLLRRRHFRCDSPLLHRTLHCAVRAQAEFL